MLKTLVRLSNQYHWPKMMGMNARHVRCLALQLQLPEIQAATTSSRRQDEATHVD